jgi:general nucleoside transport system permease protein
MDISPITTAILSILGLSPLLVLSAIGILIANKSGVFNIGVQGNIAIGTTFGILGVFFFGSLWAGLALGFLAGLAVAVVSGYLTINKPYDQLQIGFGIWFLTEGLAGFIYFMTMNSAFRVEETLPSLYGLDIIFFSTIAITVVYYLVIHRTKYGLAVVAAGENPGAADVAGISVFRVRWICTLVGGSLLGLAGSWFSIIVLRHFFYNMVAGYGWLPILTVIFAGFAALPTFLAALFFSFLIGMQTRIQVYGFLPLPREIILVLPYIFGAILLIASGVLRKKKSAPAALGHPYERE